jgi:mono/diheme cytochrome c family protein
MKNQLLIAFLLIVVSGCGSKQDPVHKEAGGTTVSGAVTFSGQIKSLLDKNCVACHSSDLQGAEERNGAPPQYNFNTYQDAKASARDANHRIQAGVMPPSAPLDDSDRALFQARIDQGLLP